MDDYDHLISSLQEAAVRANDRDAAMTYRVFGPGGYSWLEIADVLEALRNEVTVLQEDLAASAGGASDSEPEYEYSYTHESAFGAGRILSEYDSWYSTMERAEKERVGDRRYRADFPTFLVARTKAGDVFKLNPEEDQ